METERDLMMKAEVVKQWLQLRRFKSTPQNIKRAIDCAYNWTVELQPQEVRKIRAYCLEN